MEKNMIRKSRKKRMEEAKQYWLKLRSENKIIEGVGYERKDLPVPNGTEPSVYCYNHTILDKSQKMFPHHKKGYLCFMLEHDGKDKGKHKYKYIGFNKEATLGFGKALEVFVKDYPTTPIGIWHNGKYYASTEPEFIERVWGDG